MTQLQTTYRKNVIEHLELLSSKEGPLEYQRNVPIANVTAELFCDWFDDGIAGAISSKARWFRNAFSAQEYAAIKQFHQVFDSFPHSVERPYITDYVETEEFAKISQAARTALEAFKTSPSS